MVRRLLLAAAFAALSFAATAAPSPTTIGLHLGTAHSQPGLCDANPGLYVVRPDGITAGVYRNSECRLSAYAGHTWRTSGRLSFGLTAGLVTGYRARTVGPLLVPSAALAISNDAAVRLTYLPRAEKGGASGLHLSLEYRL